MPRLVGIERSHPFNELGSVRTKVLLEGRPGVIKDESHHALIFL